MTIESASISNEIFKLLHGYGYQVDSMYTLDGQEITDPDEARRFYNKKASLMVTIDDESSALEISVNLGSDSDITELKPVLNNIRNIAVKNLAEYTLNTFGKGITPKDFAFQAKRTAKHQEQDLEEGLSRLSGNTMESFQTLDDEVKLIVQHTEAIDPGVRGARSRRIANLFVENSDGERFKFPVANLTAGRVMTRYINEGGKPGDQVGQYIVSLAEEKQFLKKASRQLVHEHAVTCARTRLAEVTDSLNSMSKKRKFQQFMEEFDSRTTRTINESDFATVLENDLEGLDDELRESAHCQGLAHEVLSTKHGKECDGLIERILDHLKESPIQLSEDFADDPLMPQNLKFYDLNEKIRYQLEYCAKAAASDNDELADTTRQLAELAHTLSPKKQKFLEKVLTYGLNSATM